MEKKSYISANQIILILCITRLLFSSSYQSYLNAGASVQDTLPSLIANFVVNLIVAAPILMLLKRYPRHSLAECAVKVLGRPLGVVVCIIYCMFFIANASLVSGNFGNFFITDVISDATVFVTLLLLVTVCVYGALKGIESLARVGSVVAIIYFLTFIIIFLTLKSWIKIGYVKPLFFNGPGLFLNSSVMNYNLSTQIILFAFLVPFQRKGSITKTYFLWSLLTFAVLFLLELSIVVVLGAYGAKQIYPLQLLARLSKIGIFDRLDAVDMISWILNTVITVALNIYLAVLCLLNAGLNKYRKLTAVIVGILVLFPATMVSTEFEVVQKMMCDLRTSGVLTILIVVIPCLIVIVDIIKKRVEQIENNA